jgi:large subunit ribosomal protein L9
MRIILRQEVENLGSMGDIVEVKDGYARNYLIPKGWAVPATKQTLRQFEEEKKRLLLKENKERRAAEALAEQLSKISITAHVAVGEEDKIFGAVTSQDVAQLLQEKGFDIDRRKIVLEEPIKALGIYEVSIKLHSDVVAKVKVWVVKE